MMMDDDTMTVEIRQEVYHACPNLFLISVMEELIDSHKMVTGYVMDNHILMVVVVVAHIVAVHHA